MIIRGYHHRRDLVTRSLQINKQNQPALQVDLENLRRRYGATAGIIHLHEKKPLDLIIGFHRTPGLDIVIKIRKNFPKPPLIGAGAMRESRKTAPHMVGKPPVLLGEQGRNIGVMAR